MKGRRARSDEWFVERKNGLSGPYTGTKLKALAAEGRVSLSDLIRKGADGKPVSASRVKGLFQNPAAPKTFRPRFSKSLFGEFFSAIGRKIEEMKIEETAT